MQWVIVSRRPRNTGSDGGVHDDLNEILEVLGER